MQKIKFISKVLMLTAIVIFITMIFSGCSIINNALEKASEIESKDKIQCTVNVDNGTQIEYDDKTYQILEEKVDKSELGGWIGVFRNIAILDENYKVITQIKMELDPFTQLKNIVQDPPENARYAVPFYNAFAILNVDDDEEIAVHLFSGFYKAVCKGLTGENDKVIQYNTESLSEIMNELN